MKQVIILEEHEITRLVRGRQIEIVTPSGVILLGFDSTMKKEKETESSYCKICDKTLKNPKGLSFHNHKVHGGINKK